MVYKWRSDGSSDEAKTQSTTDLATLSSDGADVPESVDDGRDVRDDRDDRTVGDEKSYDGGDSHYKKSCGCGRKDS